MKKRIIDGAQLMCLWSAFRRSKIMGCLWGALICHQAHAVCSRPVEVAFSPVPPDLFINEKGQRTGVAVDFLNEISKRTGCQFKYLDVPRVRAWLMWEQQQIDMVPGAVPTAERDKYGTYLDHVFFEPVVLISLKKHPVKLDHSKSIIDSSITMVMVRGYNYGPKFTAFIDQFTDNPKIQNRLETALDPESTGRKLVRGRIDAVIIAASTFVDVAAAQGITDQVYAQPIQDLDWSGTGLYLTPNRLPKADIDLLTQAIQKLNAEGFYGERMKDYINTYPDWAKNVIRFKPLNTD